MSRLRTRVNGLPASSILKVDPVRSPGPRQRLSPAGVGAAGLQRHPVPDTEQRRHAEAVLERLSADARQGKRVVQAVSDVSPVLGRALAGAHLWTGHLDLPGLRLPGLAPAADTAHRVVTVVLQGHQGGLLVFALMPGQQGPVQLERTAGALRPAPLRGAQLSAALGPLSGQPGRPAAEDLQAAGFRPLLAVPFRDWKPPNHRFVPHGPLARVGAGVLGALLGLLFVLLIPVAIVSFFGDPFSGSVLSIMPVLDSARDLLALSFGTDAASERLYQRRLRRLRRTQDGAMAAFVPPTKTPGDRAVASAWHDTASEIERGLQAPPITLETPFTSSPEAAGVNVSHERASGVPTRMKSPLPGRQPLPGQPLPGQPLPRPVPETPGHGTLPAPQQRQDAPYSPATLAALEEAEDLARRLGDERRSPQARTTAAHLDRIRGRMLADRALLTSGTPEEQQGLQDRLQAAVDQARAVWAQEQARAAADLQDELTPPAPQSF